MKRARPGSSVVSSSKMHLFPFQYIAFCASLSLPKKSVILDGLKLCKNTHLRDAIASSNDTKFITNFFRFKDRWKTKVQAKTC